MQHHRLNLDFDECRFALGVLVAFNGNDAGGRDGGASELLAEYRFRFNPLSSTGIQALVAACQAGAISQDTLLHNLRTGEILPSARTHEQELALIRKEPVKVLTTDEHGFEAERLRLKADFANAAPALMAG